MLSPAERRSIGVGVTLLLHVAMILGWQAARHRRSICSGCACRLTGRLTACRGPDCESQRAHAWQIPEQARREAGDIDRALRKKSNPYIVAPLDSPQIRMAQKFAEAAALAPNRLWEAPKVVELVNDSGDGARRTRVITAAGIYCITERAPTTSIDMIEKSGKQRITNCGHEHEQPARPQQWRTARD